MATMNDLTRFIGICKEIGLQVPMSVLYDPFRDLLSSPELASFVNLQLRNLIDVPGFDAIEWNPNRLIIESDETYALHLAIHERAPQFLYSSPSEGIIGVLGSNPLRYKRYVLPNDWADDVFDKSVRPISVGEYEIARGQAITFGTRDVVDFVIDEPVVLLKLFSNRFRPLLWSFERETLTPRQAHSADLVPTILTYMMKVVAEFGNDESMQALQKLTAHPYHFVRWEAIKSLGKMNTSQALAALERASHDSHPHIRRAACVTLENAQRQVA